MNRKSSSIVKSQNCIDIKTSQERLINSDFLTIEMAVNYLFQWRTKQNLVKLLLQRIRKFTKQKLLSYIPTITFIMSVNPNDLFEQFAQSLATQSLSMYLMIRWSYSTFWTHHAKLNELRHNKLDSSLIKKFKSYKELPKQSVAEEELHKTLQQKLALSNYIQILNDFYERLFKLPEKLKKHEKEKRKSKLKGYLQSIQQKFMKQLSGHKQFIKGIILPIQNQSCIMTRILKDYCFPFSTKQRVPFKIVIQTVSIEDCLKYSNGYFLKQEIQVKKNLEQQNQKFLILPHTYFGQQWLQTKRYIYNQSPYKLCPSYRIRTYMVKSGDDLRQQYMAMQLIKMIQEIVNRQNLKLWVKSYSVIPFNQDSGLIQFVDDTRTVSYLKEKSGEKSLKRIYKQIFGDNWQKSLLNFTQSLAGYSIVQYLFQIKDRHNNNILIDSEGHVIHIDFSFMLSSSPGNMNFEQAPFKFTQDYLQIMEGPQSDIFMHYRMLFFLALKYIRKYKKQIMELVLMMSHCQGMKCFKKFERQKLQYRFHQTATDEQLQAIVDLIMRDAWNSYSTSNYDRFQWYTNTIYS